MADSVTEDGFRRRHVSLRELLARGVPYPIAVEAIASVELDQDDGGAHTGRGPSWLVEDDDGVRIVDRD